MAEQKKFCMDSETEKTAAALAKQEKVRIRIPKNELNEEDMVVPVCINGYLFLINRGEAVEVPKTVAEILEGAGYI